MNKKDKNYQRAIEFYKIACRELIKENCSLDYWRGIKITLQEFVGIPHETLNQIERQVSGIDDCI